jgi:hypothetical protein
MAKTTRRGEPKQHTPNIGNTIANAHKRNKNKQQPSGSSVRANQWKKAKAYWNTHKQRFGEGSIEDADFQATGDAMRTMPIANNIGWQSTLQGLMRLEKYATQEVVVTLKMPPMLTHSGRFRARHTMPRIWSTRTLL